MRLRHTLALAVCLASCAGVPQFDGSQLVESDPHVPKRRSKGEKARNRKYRGSRP